MSLGNHRTRYFDTLRLATKPPGAGSSGETEHPIPSPPPYTVIARILHQTILLTCYKTLSLGSFTFKHLPEACQSERARREAKRQETLARKRRMSASSALQEADANKRLKRTTKTKKLSRKVKENLAQHREGFAILKDKALSESNTSTNNAYQTSISTKKYL